MRALRLPSASCRRRVSRSAARTRAPPRSDRVRGHRGEQLRVRYELAAPAPRQRARPAGTAPRPPAKSISVRAGAVTGIPSRRRTSRRSSSATVCEHAPRRAAGRCARQPSRRRSAGGVRTKPQIHAADLWLTTASWPKPQQRRELGRERRECVVADGEDAGQHPMTGSRSTHRVRVASRLEARRAELSAGDRARADAPRRPRSPGPPSPWTRRTWQIRRCRCGLAAFVGLSSRTCARSAAGVRGFATKCGGCESARHTPGWATRHARRPSWRRFHGSVALLARGVTGRAPGAQMRPGGQTAAAAGRDAQTAAGAASPAYSG